MSGTVIENQLLAHGKGLKWCQATAQEFSSESGGLGLLSVVPPGLSRNHAVETQVVAPWIFAQGEE